MMYENTRTRKEGNAARKTGNNEYWPQNLELFAKKKLVLGENVDLLVFCQPVAQICINLNLFISLSLLVL